MLFRPAPKLKAWLDTDLCRQWVIKGMAKLLIGRHLFAGLQHERPANDRDYIRW